MNFIDHSTDFGTREPAAIGAGSIRCFRPKLLTGIIDAIWDLDIPDSETAKAFTIKWAPGTSLLLMAQYRAPALVRQGGRILPYKCATQIQSSSLTLQPTGALGFVIVCVRPDAANRVVSAPLGQFANANIHLGNIFSRGDVSACDELLAGARNSSERIATVEAFLIRRARPERDSLASHAASCLRRNPTLPMKQVASMLNVSTRQLSRSFNATFGMPPKQFARLARIEKIVAERRKGLSWAEIACACDLADQSHLAREFRGIIGEGPTEFFAHEIREGTGRMTEANFVVQRSV